MADPIAPTRQSVTSLRPTGGVEGLIGYLRSAGWEGSDLRRHGLDHQGESGRVAYRRFWQTAGEIAVVLNRAGVEPVIVKSWRVYPFVDSNVDVIAPRGDGGTFISSLVASGRWSRPAARDAAVQQSFEPRKLKLPPLAHELLPAHVYDGLRWRHQPSLDIARVAPELLAVRTDLRQLFPETDAEWVRATFRSPTLEFELILQAIHALEENYRLSLGEIVHVRCLVASPDVDWAAVVTLERALGVEGATAALRHAVAGAPERPVASMWEDAFVRVPVRTVVGYSTRRAAGLLRSGRALAAAAMLTSGTVWPIAASLYRAMKRGRR